ncbi:MAG: penicillin-binding protein 2 [Bacteroidales bacterium]|nr:penicillin-binding protein 2 [Bacteroidales bacterium]
MEFNRKNKLLAGLVIFAVILLGRIFYIQVIDGRYKSDSIRNSMVRKYTTPPRGIIYDRNGEILVGNKMCYDLYAIPRELGKIDSVALAEILDTSLTFICDRLKYLRDNRVKLGWQQIPVIKQMSEVSYMRFSEEQYRFEGLKTETRTIRDYPFNAGGNLLGYISEVSPDYMSRHPGEYSVGDYYGKTGLEAAREKDLRGEKGYHILLRDSRNRVQTAYNEGKDDQMAVPGKDIITTIDARLQQYGQQLMQGKKGSIVAIEPATGEILAMVSSPGIDVNILSDVGKHYAAIARNPNKPMFNRTVMASYPPGSVFKIVNGLIGLQEGVLKPEYHYSCFRGYQYAKDRTLGCHSHPSPLDLNNAIAMSCNSYFCNVFKNILENPRYDSLSTAFSAWREYVLSFGFGQKLGSDFPAELGGNIPSAAFYNRRYGRGHWRFPTIVSLSIGQGEIGATPLQIANLAAILANRGYYYIPHIVKDSEGIEIDSKYHERHYTLVDTLNFQKVIYGMWKAVNGGPGSGGTAVGGAVPGLDICGKTGTAQNPHGDDHSVFICFAPRENPKIAVAAYVENAGAGSSYACPVATLMVEKYLTGTIKPERKDKEARILKTRLMR